MGKAIMRVFITPRFDGPDAGEGGIRRVIEAQHKYLPTLGVDVVDRLENCDLVAAHAVEVTHTDKPVVSHNHGLYWEEYSWSQWAKNANKQVIESIHRADAVTAVSEWVAQAIRRNTMIDPTVIYHGVDPDEWPILPRKTQGPSYVLWNKTRPDPICDPTPMQSLATLCPDIQFMSTFGDEQKNVQITGKVPYDAAKQFIRDADIYLCTARETFGIGTIEAMVCGVPILGWNWGGSREIVEHRVDGWLSTPGDFADLERGLRYILENKERMGKAAREKVLSKFTWQKIMPEYVRLYESVLKAVSPVRVSVVVPCFNLGHFLPDTIKSIVSQPALTTGNTDIIIVDDASTDGSDVVCDTLAEQYPQVTVIHNKQNEYLASALNIGIRAAKGKYIVPLDSDNMLGDGCLPVLCDALDNDPAVDIAYGSMLLIEESGKEWVSDWPQDFNFGQQLGHHNQIPSTAMYRKKVWQRVGGYRARCRTAEDADFWCRVTSYGAIPKKVTDMVTLKYRDRHDSMSHTVKDWPWQDWYPWSRNLRIAPPISPVGGPIWTFEPTKISVVIPVGPSKGHTKYVIDAVDSLLAQDFRAWECIVVNDSGTEIPWIHPFVRVIGTGDKRGVAHARNIGIESARSKLVIPLDADDYLQPNALSALYNAQQKVGGYVYSDWIIQETGEVKESEDYDPQALLYRLPHAVTAIYPKEAWKRVGGFDETLNAWEDWDFILGLCDKGYCGARLPVPLIQYRIHAGQRREELYAQRDTLIENIKTKWAKYYTEGTVMPCGGCGGKGALSAQEVMQSRGQNQGAVSPSNNGGVDLVLLEYVGRDSGPMVFMGQKTGTQYRFGLDPSHKLKYVHRDDAEQLLLRREFREGQAAPELLQAAGKAS